LGDYIIMKLNAKIILSFGLTFSLILQSAYAETLHRLAHSKKLGAEVFVEQTGNSWCKEKITSNIKLKENSPLLKEKMPTFLHKVGLVVQKDCPPARTIEYKIYKNPGNTLVAKHIASSVDNWEIKKPEPQVTSLDDLPEPEPQSVSVPEKKSNIPVIEPVNLKYLTLLPGVIPDAQRVLSKTGGMTDYLKLRHCKTYQSVEKNEIKVSRLESEFGPEARDFLDSPPPEYALLELKRDLGHYNLEKGAFEFTPLKDYETFYLKRPDSYWGCRPQTNAFPKAIELYVEGGEFIRELPVSQDEAEKLIKRLRYRKVIVHATVKLTKWNEYSKGVKKASVESVLYALKISNERTGRDIYEFTNDWLQPQIDEKKEAIAKAEAIKRQKVREEQIRKQQEAAAKADRIKRGVEPIAMDGEVAWSHFKKLSSPKSDEYMVEGTDTRRPLHILAEAYYNEKDGSVQLQGGLFGLGSSKTEISYNYSYQGTPIKVVLQNGADFKSQKVPESIVHDVALTKQTNLVYRPDSYITFTARPVGFFDDPWKGGKGIVVHVASAEFELKFKRLKAKKKWGWKTEAISPEKPYLQKKDTRTARDLNVAGLHGGMEMDDVQELLEDKLQLNTAFDENLKTLKSSNQLNIRELLNGIQKVSPGKRYFKGTFVQTGKSLMGLGSPIYSLKQATLGQTATINEAEAIYKGLLEKFGEPDLKKDNPIGTVMTWGKRITNDRSNMSVGKEFNLPVCAVEAQLYEVENGIITILILTDELYLKETKVTSTTIY